jgi:hypothetical protein
VFLEVRYGATGTTVGSRSGSPAAGSQAACAPPAPKPQPESCSSLNPIEKLACSQK